MATMVGARRRPRVPCEDVDGVLYPYAEEHPVVPSDWHNLTVTDAVGMVRMLLRDRPALSPDPR